MIQQSWDLLMVGFTVVGVVSGAVAAFTWLGHIFGKLSAASSISSGASSLANILKD